MSRIGKKPIDIPSGMKVTLEGNKVKVEAKGKVNELALPSGLSVEIKDNKIFIARSSNLRILKALHGTTRNLMMNMIKGLVDAFQKKLEIQGVGYKAQMKGKSLMLDIGFTHSINYTPPSDVTIETPSPTEIIIKGANKQKIGEAASEIRNYYPPEPYKGKGIRYAGEYVRKKQGKTIATTT